MSKKTCKVYTETMVVNESDVKQTKSVSNKPLSIIKDMTVYIIMSKTIVSYIQLHSCNTQLMIEIVFCDLE